MPETKDGEGRATGHTTKERARDVLYVGLKTRWATNVGKAAEAKDPLLPSEVKMV